MSTATYAIDPTHSRIGFVARHAMITKVRGSFDEYTGTGTYDPADPAASTVHIDIRTASVDTRNRDRDNHLRSPEFFDVDSFPTITFTSTEIVPTGDDRFAITGDLTIKGISKPVTFDTELTGTATDPFGHERLGLEGSTRVNRKDWGLTWNALLEAGGVLVSEQITLEFEVSAVRQP